MNAHTQDIAQARAHVDRFREYLRTGTDVLDVKRVAVNITQSIFGDSALTVPANRLPVPALVGVRMRGLTPPPPERTPEFNESVEHLLRAIDEGLDGIADYQQRVNANAVVPRVDIRKSVLAYLSSKPIDIQWAGDIQWTLGLSDEQIIDALEYWEEQGAIKHGGYQIYTGGGDWIWKIEQTPRGRDLADGTRTISSELMTTLIVHQTFNGPVNNAGTVYGNVTQNITLPKLPADVQFKLRESPIGEALADAFEEEQRRSEPRPERVRKFLDGIKSFFETVNAGGETLGHLSEWSTEVGDWLSGFV